MADQAEITRHSHPLSRIVVCCTSVPPESRQDLAKKAQDMGARHVLDLTSDVTHLVCGDITTPKYKYVAKMRTDVKVMRVEWVDAMYNLWIIGEDINARDFEENYKLPVLYRLSISVTGILDVADRKKIEELVVDQQATYHPDLTRHVSHLIAAAPTGKKYEFAKSNNISVVVVKWLYDSLERGMALEESFYDPSLPLELVGAGARPALPSAAPVEVVAEVHGKRRIRKRAEDMLGSQSQSMWGDILGQASNPKPKKRDEWEDDSRTDALKETGKMTEAVLKKMLQREAALKKRFQRRNKVEVKTGILASIVFYIHGFTNKQGKTLRNVLASYDGDIASSLQDLKKSENSSRRFIVVPHNLHKRDCPDISGFGGVSTVTEWWIEACMHKGKFVEPSEGFVYSPFEEFPLEGFEGLEICLTQFSGIELLHMRKLTTLLGGSFQDFLSKTRHLLVTDLPAKGEKFEFAVQNDIPVVTAEWFQECLKESRAVPFTNFLVKRQTRTKTEISEDPGSSKRARDIGESGDKKRPRLSGINFQGGKLLGENLQSFGDGLRSIPDDKTGADADAKTSGRLSDDRDITERIGPSVDIQSDEVQGSGEKGVLDRCVVCVSRQLKARDVELSSVAKSLGASVVKSFSKDDIIPITHLIHSSKTPRDTTKYFKAASSIDNCHIVSPDWLYECEKSGKMVDETVYPSIIAPSRGLEMDFAKDSSSSLSPVNTMELQMLSEPKDDVEGNELDVNEEDETEFLPHEVDDDDFDPTYQARNLEPTPPTSAPVPTLPLSLDAGRNPSLSVQPENPGNPEPQDASDKKAPASISNILGKLGKGELTTAMDKRKRPRGKLQGKATSNLSSYSNFSRASSVSSSRAESASPPQQQIAPEVSDPKDKTPNILNKQEAELPVPSQAIRYADPEAEKERKNVRAKLSGDAFGAETPKPAKGPGRRIKTAVDVDDSGPGSGSVTRRMKRNK